MRGERLRSKIGGLRGWTELAGFWAVAIAHPVFQSIASGPEALTHLGAGVGDVILVVVLLALIPPSLLAGAIRLAGRVSRRAERALHASALGAMAGLVAWQALRGAGAGDPVVTAGLEAALPVAFAAAVAWSYLRLRFTRSLAGVLSFATPIVVLAFLVSYPVRFEVLPAPAAAEAAAAPHEAPVVLAVFDEWSLSTVLDRGGRIDGRFFPNLKRLSGEATWYPNALADASMTAAALPAMLTGKAPAAVEREAPPSAGGYPENLCRTLAGAGYEVAGTEPYSSFCGSMHGIGTRVAGLLQQGSAAAVAPAGVVGEVTGSLASVYPVEPRWRGRETRLPEAIRDVEAVPGSFTFLHTLLPHFPWYITPSGQYYELPSESDAVAVSGKSQWLDQAARIDYAEQRLMLQAGFADRMIGKLVDRLKRRGEWRDAMVIVVADHGATVRPGKTRRGLEEDAFAALGSVPLLIKYPGRGVDARTQSKVPPAVAQPGDAGATAKPDEEGATPQPGEARLRENGVVDRRLARTIDIVPTIYRELGVDPEIELDGRPLHGPPRPWPERIAIQDGETRVSITVRELKRQAAALAARRARLFGSGSLFAIGGQARLLGAELSRSRRATAIGYRFSEPGIIDSFHAAPGQNAAVFDVELERPPRTRSYLVAHGGVVLASARPYREEAGAWKLTVVLPASERRRSPQQPIELIPAD